MFHSKELLEKEIISNMEFGGKVPSNSKEGVDYFVWFKDGVWNCNCMAGSMGAKCKHIRKMALEIVHTHEEKKCWYCDSTYWAENGVIDRHHVERRSTSPELAKEEYNIMDLCRTCHERATVDGEFEENLKKLWKEK